MDPANPSNQPDASNEPMSPTSDENDTEANLVRNPTIATLAAEAETDTSTTPSHSVLSRQLALAIQKVSLDLRLPKAKRYAYEDWVEFTRLIRLTTPEKLDRALGRVISRADIEDENEEGLVNWDWIGNDSPLMSGESESQWLMGRLCESLVRLERRREVFDAGSRTGLMGFGMTRTENGGENGNTRDRRREDEKIERIETTPG